MKTCSWSDRQYLQSHKSWYQFARKILCFITPHDSANTLDSKLKHYFDRQNVLITSLNNVTYVAQFVKNFIIDYFLSAVKKGASIIFNEEIFLFVIQKSITIQPRLGLHQWCHSIAIIIDAKDFSILILDLLVIAVVLAAQIKTNASISKSLLIARTICGESKIISVRFWSPAVGRLLKLLFIHLTAIHFRHHFWWRCKVELHSIGHLAKSSVKQIDFKKIPYYRHNLN